MKCENIQDKLMAFVSEELTHIESEYIQRHIIGCEDCQKEVAELKEVVETMTQMPVFHPSKNLQRNFEQMLQTEEQFTQNTSFELNPKKIRALWNFPLVQMAASVVILALGIWIGMQIQPKQSNAEVTEFQEELQDMKQLVMLSMLEKPSASERIKAVHSVSELKEPAPQITDALIQTLNKDHNVNVRLAAISALSRFSTNSSIRKSVIEALPLQQDPIVQIALINLLVSWEEKDATKVLQNLLQDQRTLEVVKNQAEKGLAILM